MGQLSASMEQTRETQLAQLYDVLGFRRVIARNDVLSTLHETGPCTIRALNMFMSNYMCQKQGTICRYVVFSECNKR